MFVMPTCCRTEQNTSFFTLKESIKNRNPEIIEIKKTEKYLLQVAICFILLFPPQKNSSYSKIDHK